MRIIYKINSSWDFISSQIIKLKRRWNSKMAISIKNHEDRITALENVSSTKKTVKNILPARVNFNNNQTKDISLSESITNFDIMSIEFFGYSDGNMENLSPTVFLVKSLLDNAKINVYKGGDGKSSITRKLFISKVTNTSIKVHFYDIHGYILRILGLKLYYNFSYNITREFYKVKFKLRHYLCSHLQKFI